eukprot:CAMPEP_0114373076 /NCGR_PEP_ID=MMETSP0101-20121206/34609_1 /TAXON_ID=38822 ORGANISM="Pteridomonas danica, Strain PT" /NCGR_SAMPLE_ID=MMETSP0101 /ASSEMBLY_ACC=CAM_ASM_000211 /LENGTH=610 /DNA_ID=CAMNT_0001526165 /DNA_START=39 /DNA_END=1868 /DNA_ORIENTATION=-
MIEEMNDNENDGEVSSSPHDDQTSTSSHTHETTSILSNAHTELSSIQSKNDTKEEEDEENSAKTEDHVEGKNTEDDSTANSSETLKENNLIKDGDQNTKVTTIEGEEQPSSLSSPTAQEVSGTEKVDKEGGGEEEGKGKPDDMIAEGKEEEVEKSSPSKGMDEISFDSVFSLTLERVDAKLMRRLPREVLAMERRATRAAVARVEVENSAQNSALAAQEIKKSLRKIQFMCSRKYRNQMTKKLKRAFEKSQLKSVNDNTNDRFNHAAGGATASSNINDIEKDEKKENEEEDERDYEINYDESIVTNGLSCLFKLVHQSLHPSVTKLAKDLETVGNYASTTADDASTTHPTSVSSVKSWGKGCVTFNNTPPTLPIPIPSSGVYSIHTNDNDDINNDNGNNKNKSIPSYLYLSGGLPGVSESYGPIMAVNSLRVIGQCCFRNRTASEFITGTEGFEEMVRFCLEETRQLIMIKQTRSQNKQVSWMMGGEVGEQKNKHLMDENGNSINNKRERRKKEKNAKRYDEDLHSQNHPIFYGDGEHKMEEEENEEETKEMFKQQSNKNHHHHHRTTTNMASDNGHHVNDGASDSDSDDDSDDDHWLNNVISKADQIET